ncbi:MAG: Asp-tRNA(Asn)/Glu-tRNA(Gln) amidotransferase subunit GatC [Candidatus Omnitrophica bacterium]|nr:Asp-tRNA(Asn)/Glu-tRNA(Gln) amidotransferase subunit GatC [Candidatus Omnitrophota bacterium]MDD5352584.1 Asp-tRNA(Asn)/Glu-tRNA(Gln) amidotransferase subunit GatC [Candidatus Omnitrophota bacterium]MDD5550182.1 Asp-tRNA(Asn)/Glu-tRNA(Gln) amidotransferase subunit GatC [Candidatus Omnitrophota bacterium]
MNITKDTVKYVANLARLELAEEELEKFSLQLNDILRYIEQLKEVDISKIPPTAHVLPIKNVTRKDKLRPSLKAEEVLKNSPQKQGKFFKVPKVIE